MQPWIEIQKSPPPENKKVMITNNVDSKTAVWYGTVKLVGGDWIGFDGAPIARVTHWFDPFERFTSREKNLLESMANWLDTRSKTVWAKANPSTPGMMQSYAADLRHMLTGRFLDIPKDKILSAIFSNDDYKG